jgi:hypothetical protein
MALVHAIVFNRRKFYRDKMQVEQKMKNATQTKQDATEAHDP